MRIELAVRYVRKTDFAYLFETMFISRKTTVHNLVYDSVQTWLIF